jgi:hypothetical protein
MTSQTPSRLTALNNSSRRLSLQAALDQVVSQEAHRNELQLSYVRAGVLLISFVLDVTVFLFPQALLGKDHIPPWDWWPFCVRGCRWRPCTVGR